jgi:hypothetical protein
LMKVENKGRERERERERERGRETWRRNEKQDRQLRQAFHQTPELKSCLIQPE